MDLSLNLKAIIAQQLVPLADGSDRRAAIETVINTSLIGDLIRKGEVHKLKELMARSNELGMRTFGQALFELYEKELISYEDAMLHTDSKNDLRLLMKLQSNTDPGYLSHAADELQIEEDRDDRVTRF
ncbi:MAG: twitching motility protein PilU [Porticoccus sp.]|jgi:twitching motility protein PilU